MINVAANTGEIVEAIKKIQSGVKIGGGDCGVGDSDGGVAGATPKMGAVLGAGLEKGGAGETAAGDFAADKAPPKSSQLFLQFLKSGDFFKIPRQKIFHDRI